MFLAFSTISPQNMKNDKYHAHECGNMFIPAINKNRGDKSSWQLLQYTYGSMFFFPHFLIDDMNKVILSIFGAIFILGVLLRILFALFYPDKFAEGARKVLFIDEREKALFQPADTKLKQSKKNKDSTSDI